MLRINPFENLMIEVVDDFEAQLVSWLQVWLSPVDTEPCLAAIVFCNSGILTAQIS